jgi:hypothetical protein
VPVVAARIAVQSNKPSLDAALEGLVRLNLTMFRVAAQQGRPVPSVYKAGIHWQRDKGETWDTADIVRRRGYGDCEDLAAWRAAELRMQGIPAAAVVRASNSPNVAWHAIVALPGGKFEDPSAKLGMYDPRYRNLAGDSLPAAVLGENPLAIETRTALRSAAAQLMRALRAAGV